jgi:hypothetical protein
MVPEPPPILLAVASPGPQPRFGVLFRLILAIPHLFLIVVLGIAAEVVAFLGWWGALFTARLPQFAVDYLSGYLRWATRVFAYLYLLTDAYPPFSFGDAPEFPVSVAIPAPQRLNRAAVFFRFILLIPVEFLTGILVYGAGTLMAFIAWLVTLVAGRLPSSFHLAYAALLRFQTRYYGYAFMLTPAYPGGLYGDQPSTVTWADGAQAAQPPGFSTPGSAYDVPGWGYGVPGQEASGGYGTPGYDAPGYAAPGGYDAPGYTTQGWYGAGAGYQAQPAGQPGRWLLPLTSGAKGLITVFIVLGVLLDVGGGVVRAISTSSTISTAIGTAQLNQSAITLDGKMTSYETAVAACNENLTCVTRQDGVLAADLSTFNGQLSSTSLSGNLAADRDKLAAATTTLVNDLNQLSQATSAADYQSIVTQVNLQQAFDNWSADFAQLSNDS